MCPSQAKPKGVRWMAAYYNENDPKAAQWLRNLIAAGHIAPGVVDDRSILDVRPEELRGYTQCHFFAGIGVWSYALRRAGWGDDRPVWTGSCPCQPFSSAGAQSGFDDERHLWPHFQWLIEQCRPAEVFGEQVASKAVEPWIDLVQADLEALGYAFAGIPFPSASVGAPHIRDRLFWVAHTDAHGRHEGVQSLPGEAPERFGGDNQPIWMGDPNGTGLQEHGELRELHLRQPDRQDTGRLDLNTGLAIGLADTQREQRQGRLPRPGQSSSAKSGGPAIEPAGLRHPSERPSPTNGFWGAADWLLCTDGKWRPVEPGTSPLVDGSPARVVRLRAYGNAINAEAAKEFICAYLESAGRPDLAELDDLI